jgi:eukaryotic-like serine/threonine-protein kinase
MYGQYEVLERIAVGGMAEIYLGVSRGAEGFSRQVVIKKVRSTLSTDERFVRMLIKEAKITASLNHPNIVQILDLGQNDHGEYFIVMEYVEGHDLRSVMDQAAVRGVEFDRHVALYIASEVCAALDHAHRKTDDKGQPLRLIHRDVSPSNILISYAGEVKLTDFGIARYGRDVSVVGSLKGKLAYMSPEQARGRPIDHRSDIFSLGSILFELTLGRKVFLAETDLDLLEQVRVASIPLPSTLDPEIPLELEQTLLRALAPTPEARFASADEMQAALREFQFHHVDRRIGAQDLSELLELLFPVRRTRHTPTRVQFTVATMASFHSGLLDYPLREGPTPVGEVPPDLLQQTAEPWDAILGPIEDSTLGSVSPPSAPLEPVPTTRLHPSAFAGHLHLLKLVTAIPLPDAPDEGSVQEPSIDEPAMEELTAAVDPSSLAAKTPTPKPVFDPVEASDVVPLPARRTRHTPHIVRARPARRSWTTWILVAAAGLILGSGLAMVFLWQRPMIPSQVPQDAAPRRGVDARRPADAGPRDHRRDAGARPDRRRAADAATSTEEPTPRDKTRRKRTRRVKTRSASPPATTTGQLVIKSEPWAYISIDGKNTRLTTSATPIPVAVGAHQIELVNPALNLRHTLSVTIEAGAVVKRFVRLRQ